MEGEHPDQPPCSGILDERADPVLVGMELHELFRQGGRRAPEPMADSRVRSEADLPAGQPENRQQRSVSSKYAKKSGSKAPTPSIACRRMRRAAPFAANTSSERV